MNKFHLKISRSGSARRCGTTSIQMTPCFFRCNEKGISFEGNSVYDFNGQSRHNYTLEFTHEVIQAFIRSVNEAARKSPNVFEKILEPSLKNFYQLQVVASGTLSNHDALQKTDLSLNTQRLLLPNKTELPYVDSQCKIVNSGKTFSFLRNKNV